MITKHLSSFKTPFSFFLFKKGIPLSLRENLHTKHVWTNKNVFPFSHLPLIHTLSVLGFPHNSPSSYRSWSPPNLWAPSPPFPCISINLCRCWVTFVYHMASMFIFFLCNLLFWAASKKKFHLNRASKWNHWKAECLSWYAAGSCEKTQTLSALPEMFKGYCFPKLMQMWCRGELLIRCLLMNAEGMCIDFPLTCLMKDAFLLFI